MTCFSAFHVRKMNRNPCGFAYEKNFFALILHTYIDTLYNLLMYKNLQRFQILPKPTLILH